MLPMLVLIALGIYVYYALTPVLSTQKELEEHLAGMAENLQTTAVCRFEGELYDREHPSLLSSSWYNYAQAIHLYMLPKLMCHFRLEFKDHTRILAAHQNPDLLAELTEEEKLALQVARNRVAQLVRTGMSEREIVRALHDDLIRRTRYSREATGCVTEVFLHGKGLCESYSRALYTLLKIAGLQAHIVVGSSMGEAHAWNLVLIDDQWLHVDATWDDPVSSDGRDILQHDYFCRSHEQMSRTHSWPPNLHLPGQGRKFEPATPRQSVRWLPVEMQEEIRRGIADGSFIRKAGEELSPVRDYLHQLKDFLRHLAD